MPAPPTFRRSPRLTPPLPAEVIEIPAPPSDPNAESDWGNILITLLPILFMVAILVIISRFTSMGSTFLLFSVPIMVASGIATVIIEIRRRNQKKQLAERRDRGYRELLRENQRHFQELLSEQQSLQVENDPAPQVCLRNRVTIQHRRLWAKAPEDPDFLVLRVGLGRRPAFFTIKPPHISDPLDRDPLVLKAQKLASQFEEVPYVPVTISLPAAGIVGLAGENDRVLKDAARALLIQLATHHAPIEVKLIALYPEEEGWEWDWVRWLPHVWNNKQNGRYVATNRQSAHDLLANLDEFLNQRRKELQRFDETQEVIFPSYVVLFIADPLLVENEPFIDRLESEGQELGVFAIFLGKRIKELPRSCRMVDRLFNDHAELYMSTSDTYSIALRHDLAALTLAKEFAKKIAPIRFQQSQSKEIPSSISLLDMFGVRDVRQLNVQARWEDSTGEGRRRSLASPIGLRAGSEPLIIDLHERKHGPNGLVAGMVGAGKSILLQALVASLAINYHPHRVAFVLIDYKGGGMAKPFKALPHNLGNITDLQEGNLAVRALTSFRVEIRRRKELFEKSSESLNRNINHIDEYQNAYYEGELPKDQFKPLPHLVVIVDEFAEMKTEEPEIAGEFVKIARVGRALGLCMILAMQKPTGIVDAQIEGNTRFRLSLRVASTEDSQALLKRTDAAFLAGVGRAFFQVGTNELFEEFQVAFTEAQYDPAGIQAEDPEAIVKVELDGSRQVLLSPTKIGHYAIEERKSHLEAVVEHVAETARVEQVELLEELWLDPLPELCTLDEIMGVVGWNGEIWGHVEDWLSPIIGKIDDPRNKTQEPLHLDLGRSGHALLYSAPGYGKTTFLQTLIVSLARTYTPEDVHIYVLDFAGRLLSMFEALPHVGSVIVSDDIEKVERLLGFLRDELDVRRKIFGDERVGTLQAYRQKSKESLPAIVVIFDNHASFLSTYQDDDDRYMRTMVDQLEKTVEQLVREGGAYGIHLVMTANEVTSVRYKTSANVNLKLAMTLADESDYLSVVGRTEGLFPEDTPGRGLINLKKGEPPLEFQIALPSPGDTDGERSEKLNRLIDSMVNAWSGPTAPSIKTLPDVLPLSDLISITDKTTDTSSSVPLGIYVSNLQPINVSLEAGPNFLICGAPQSGKTSLLQTWLLALAERLSPNELEVYILDSLRGGLALLERLPHIKGYSRSIAKASQLTEKVEDILYNRRELLDYDNEEVSTEKPQKQVRRSRIILVVDDIRDSYDDGTDDIIKHKLAKIMERGRNLDIHILIAGSIDKLKLPKGWSSDNLTEPVDPLKIRQTGFLLGSSSDEVFNLRIPIPERGQLLPAGEGYWINRGRAHKVKFACAHVNDKDVQILIDDICARYTNPVLVDDED